MSHSVSTSYNSSSLRNSFAMRSVTSSSQAFVSRQSASVLKMMRKSTRRNLPYDPWNAALVWAMNDHPEGLWKPAKVISHIKPENGEEWTFEVEFDSKHKSVIQTKSVDEVNNLEFEWVKRRDKSDRYSSINDMTHLSYLNEPEMLECLRHRYAQDKIYTNTGPILLAVNPFKRLPIYSSDYLSNYYDAGINNQTKEPHVFSTSDRAYRKMFIDRFDPTKRENQAILVNGESGAGKTETTKYVLHYLAEVSSFVASNANAETASTDIESQIIASNPITESFGNAKTSRNNNSSRFGKYIELLYSADGYIEGARIRTYLLETIRVVRQGRGDRNFHIFYELFAGLAKEFREEMGFYSLEEFAYTNQSGELHRYDNESDEGNYNSLLDALSTLNIDNECQDQIIRIIVGILHIGNLDFVDTEDSNSAEVATFSKECRESKNYACDLLGVDEKALTVAVTERAINVAGAEITKKLVSEAASYARDNLAKTVYELLFRWIITQVNIALSSDMEEEHASSIGILDIFGFEHFKHNSFEQLCINYTNEKLQDHFNYAIFKSEQEVYTEEGLMWKFVSFPDNYSRVELLENKTVGIFAICDEQLKIPKANDDKLAKILYDKCSKHKFFNASNSEKANSEFTIQHYAGPVKYEITGFLDKNRSEMAKEILECLSTSQSDLLTLTVINPKGTLLPKLRGAGGSGSGPKQKQKQPSRQQDPKGNAARPTRTGGFRQYRDSSLGKKLTAGGGKGKNIIGKRMITVSAEFVKDLNELMVKIRVCRSHFIRCIKPNALLQKSNFNAQMVMEQLRCGGVLGAIQVFRAGFPNRMDFESFCNRYSILFYASGVNFLTRSMFRYMDSARGLVNNSQWSSPACWKLAASNLMKIVPLAAMVLQTIDPEDCPSNSEITAGLQMGKTQILMKASIFEFLERLQHRAFTLLGLRLAYYFKAKRYFKRQGKLTRGVKAAAENAAVEFATIKRYQAIKRVKAMLLIQRRAKVFLAVCRRKRIIRSVTRLQAMFRGRRSRLHMRNRILKGVVRIQSFFRMLLLSRRYKKMRRGMISFQILYRYFIKKNGPVSEANRKFMSQNRVPGGRGLAVPNPGRKERTMAPRNTTSNFGEDDDGVKRGAPIRDRDHENLQRELEREREKQRELEKEKEKQQRELEKEREKQREMERERDKQRELEREREKQRELEREREKKQRELEREREKQQRELEREKDRLAMLERLQQEQQEEEKKRLHLESQRLKAEEEERRKTEERNKQLRQEQEEANRLEKQRLLEEANRLREQREAAERKAKDMEEARKAADARARAAEERALLSARETADQAAYDRQALEDALERERVEAANLRLRQKELENEKALWEDFSRNAEDSMSEDRNIIEELKQQLLRAKGEANRNAEDWDAMQRKLAYLEQLRDRLLRESENERARADNLQNDVYNMQQNQRDEANFVMEQIANLEYQVNLLEAMRQEALKQQNSTANRIRQLKDLINDLQHRKDSMENDGSYDRDEMDSIRKNLDDMRREYDYLNEQARDANRKVLDAAEKLAELRAQEAHLHQSQSISRDAILDDDNDNDENQNKWYRNRKELNDALAKIAELNKRDQAQMNDLTKKNIALQRAQADQAESERTIILYKKKYYHLERLFIILLVLMLLLLLLILLIILMF